MAVVSQQVSVGTSATRLTTTTSGGGASARLGTRASCVVRNRGAAAVYVGGSDVTTLTGFQLDVGESAAADVGVGDDLYGIVASGTVTCHVMQVGRN